MDEEEYYMQQAGTGIAVHQGVRHQKGYSFFGKILKWVSPVMRLLGKQALSSGAKAIGGFAEDYDNKKDWKESIKDRLKETGKDFAKGSLDNFNDYVQKGSGRKRKRRKTKPKVVSRKKMRRRAKKLDNLI